MISFFRMWPGKARSPATITAPGAQSAMFTGTDNANRFEGPVPASGDYAIDVFLMPKAASDGQAANYTLTVVTSGAE
jgi:hypothetical protein